MNEKYPNQELLKNNNVESSVVATEESLMALNHAQSDLLEARFLQEQKDEAEMDRIMGLVRLSERNENEYVFNDGEIFNPWRELHNIKIGTKEEQKKKLAIFKEKLVYQKKGIAEIQKFLYAEIEKPKMPSAEELKASIIELKNKYALSQEQRDIFDSAVDICVQRHEGILENTRDCFMTDGCIDGEKLFQKIFKRKPNGKIDVKTKAITVYFIISNIEDYAYAATGAYLEKRNVTNEEIEFAKNTGGRKLANSKVPGMEHVITLENVSRLSVPGFRKSSERILAHEEQHNFNCLVCDAQDNVYEEMFSVNEENELEKFENVDENATKSDASSEDAEENENDARRDSGIRFMVKDEICAYVSDGASAKGIRDMLLEEYGLYDYGEDYKKEHKKKEERFSREYVELVERGIVAMFDLVKSGYSRQEAVSLLFVENLMKWRLVVDRQLGIKKDTKKELKDMKNLNPVFYRIDRFIYRIMEKILNKFR